MKYLYKFCLLLSLFSVLILQGCKKDFLDVNNDPNRATDDNITALLIFPAAAEAAGATIVGVRAADAGRRSPMQFTQNWVGYMASNGDFARDNTETTYDIDFGFGDVLFQRRMDCMFDLHQVEVKALASGDSILAGAAMVLKAKMYQELVDLFGDLPYSEAFSIKLTTRPKYDPQTAIYADLQARLDKAIEYLSKSYEATSSEDAFAKADIVNHGDQDLWIKFANSLKLRLLIRQSQVAGFNPSTEIAKIKVDGELNILGPGENVSVNPGYANEINKQSPFYANYGLDPTGVRASTSFNANAYIIDWLTSSQDPREGRFFTRVGTNFVGNQYGAEPGLLETGGNTSYFGPGVANNSSQDQWMMPAFESMFFKAEAIARKWVNGDTRTAYEDAVRESFKFLGVENAIDTANDYLQSAAIANFDNAGTSVSSQVKFIAFQKYIANTSIDALESYSDQRRLNFLPATSPGGITYISAHPGRVSNTLPLRLLYPQREYTTNAEQVQKVGTINVFTTKLFWEP